MQKISDIASAYVQLTPEFPFNMACLNDYYLTYSNMDSVSCDDTLFSEIFTGKKRNSEAEILDLSFMNYELDQYEIKLYELYPLINYFAVMESTIAENGLRKPLIWSRNRNTYRFL